LSQAPRRDLSVPLPVGVRRADGSFRHEYLVNVSVSGLCLHMQTPVSVGEELAVAFRLPSDSEVIQGVCKVVWTSHEGRVHPVTRFYETGVCLAELSEADRVRIEVFVSAQVDRS
jgi:Tfp pilus assembly protein PilZ